MKRVIRTKNTRQLSDEYFQDGMLCTDALPKRFDSHKIVLDGNPEPSFGATEAKEPRLLNAMHLAVKYGLSMKTPEQRQYELSVHLGGSRL